ncbi:hypothetical protein, partial [Microcoleus sp. Pol12B5]|uniref:hypothetical protein n=1 Tax=Microcoleus sp. Pol12B5 TaxID=3055396 RepID=UPI002FD1B867
MQPNQSPQNLLDRARWCILPACQCQPCECECQRVDRRVASESSDRLGVIRSPRSHPIASESSDRLGVIRS